MNKNTLTLIMHDLFKVKSSDPDLRRKGKVLATVLLAIALVVVLISVVNVANQQSQYYVSDGIALILVAVLFLVNRYGLVTAASVLTVSVIAVSPFFTMQDVDVRTSYIALCLPVLLASFLIAPWTGFLFAGIIVGATLLDRIVSEQFYFPPLILIIVSVLAYLLSESLHRAYQRSTHQALHDPLTDLPNRTLLMNTLDHALHLAHRRQTAVAMLFADLDNFKVLNDSLGHDTGDRLLVAVAERLRGCLRPEDTLTRFGGDEFIVLLEDVEGLEDAVRVAERIVEDLKEPFVLDGREFVVTVSSGIALSTAGKSTPEQLLRDADAAMYKAKSMGKAGYAISDPTVNSRAMERLELEADLRHAVEKRELEVHYQPKVLLDSGTIIGVEALVRWKHPRKGYVSPAKFIPLAEETGLILSIGGFVLREACGQARLWMSRGDASAPFLLSVNLSGRQLRDPDLVRNVAETLRETGLQTENLELEITESMLMEDTETNLAALEGLKALGVTLSLDDFGTGYSSLSYLKRFPIDYLKIDKSFVGGLAQSSESVAIAQAVVALAGAMGMATIAEGVETADQVEILMNLGCRAGQGYLFARPLSAVDTAQVLADGINFTAEGLANRPNLRTPN